MLEIRVIDHNFCIYSINTLNNQFSLCALSILQKNAMHMGIFWKYNQRDCQKNIAS